MARSIATDADIAHRAQRVGIWARLRTGADPLRIDHAHARAALVLTDAMHSRYRKHVTEQLAVSWVLQTSLRILPAADVVHHYWQSCTELEPVLAGLPRGSLTAFNPRA